MSTLKNRFRNLPVLVIGACSALCLVASCAEEEFTGTGTARGRGGDPDASAAGSGNEAGSSGHGGSAAGTTSGGTSTGGTDQGSSGGDAGSSGMPGGGAPGAGGSEGTGGTGTGGTGTGGTGTGGTGTGGTGTGGTGTGGTGTGGTGTGGTGTGGTGTGGTGGTTTGGTGGTGGSSTGVSVKYCQRDNAPNDNKIEHYVRISNSSTTSYSIPNLEVRYYFTAEPTESLVYSVWYADMCCIPWDPWYVMLENGEPLVDLTDSAVIAMSPVTGADRYARLTFRSGTNVDVLGEGDYISFQAAVHQHNWGANFNETNDYSYMSAPVCTGTDPDYEALSVLNDRIVVLYNNTIIWGVPPS